MSQTNQKERMSCTALKDKIVSAEQASCLIKDGMVVSTSGFTPSGYPKAVPLALAERVKRGEKIGITLITGASVGPELDASLTEAGVIKRRYPYQTNKTMREAINSGQVKYADIILSHSPMYMKEGTLGHIDIAIVEAAAIGENGEIYPTTSSGVSNVAVKCADKVIVEVNKHQPLSLIGFHDIYDMELPPNTEPIPIKHAGDRIGKPYIECDPNKIAAIVFTDIPDAGGAPAKLDEDAEKMASNLIEFLKKEVKAGRLPKNLLPIQSGVGAVANAVLSGLAKSEFEHLQIYTEVLQDSVLDLIDAGKVDVASTTALTLTPARQKDFFENIEKYRDKIILRPQEISNHPEVIRRIGVIAINTAIEADIYGNVNSSHIGGTRLMNGIGGSGDFARNGYISIFTTASTAKNGTISSIVPAVTHLDHSEHSVQILITECGVADLRGLSPIEKAHCIIDNCANEKARPVLNSYLGLAESSSQYKHIPLVNNYASACTVIPK